MTFSMQGVKGNQSEITWFGGISLAAFLEMRQITLALQAFWTDPLFQHKLYRFRRAVIIVGQCFRIFYEVWSRELGMDIHLITK